MAQLLKVTQNSAFTPPRLLNTAAYARVSSRKTDMLHSLITQIDYFRSCIQHQPGCRFVGVYADEGLTGTKANRPEFQRLLRDCRAGKIDQVFVKSISRFTRNTVTLLTTIRELNNLNIDVYFEKENLHSLSADGELMLTLIAAVAQDESRSVSDNCKWRIRKGFSQGNVWHVRPYGYDIIDGQYVINDAESKIVKLIFSDYLAGMGINAITRKLFEMSIPFRENKKWNEGTVRKILRNERYIGDMLLQKTFVEDPISKYKRQNQGELESVYVEDNHDPIIDPSTFEDVQSRIIERSELYAHKYHGTGLYPFTGKMVCAGCGKPYRRKINAAGTKYAKPVWICRTYNQLGRNSCPSKQIPEDILYEITADVLGIKIDECSSLDQITRINVHNANVLIFKLRNGQIIERTWANKSRSESWNMQLRAQASIKAKERNANEPSSSTEAQRNDPSSDD